MIDAVLFDIGNVLIRWQPETWVASQIGQARADAFFEQTQILEVHNRVDAGAPYVETNQALAVQHPDWAPEIQMWIDNWASLAAPAIPHSVHLLRQLRARGVPVFALSNFGADTFEMSCETYDFLTEFDRSYISGRMGVIKPDADIYAQVEADCGLDPSRLLFADDRADNIAAAAARGWQVHQFTTPDLWAARLIDAGLLTAEEAQFS